MIKQILVACTLATSAFISLNATAGLRLCSTNFPQQITVVCNGQNGIPVPPSPNHSTSCISVVGVQNIMWAALHLQGLFGDCHFSTEGEELGTATLEISDNLASGKISDEKVSDANKYAAQVTPDSTFASDVSVLLTKF